MSARKKSVRTRRAKPAPPEPAAAPELPGLYRILHQLTETTEALEDAYAGIARACEGHDVALLRQGIGDVAKILMELDRIEKEFRAYRKSIGDYKEVKP
jgi:hypothetical protein